MLRQLVIGAAIGGLAGYLFHSARSSSAPKVGGKPPPPPRTEADCPPPGHRVALIGDSYADGLLPYIAEHAARCETKFYGDGHVGSSVLQWTGQSSWLQEARAFHPTVVLVSLGGNDFQRGPVNDVHAAIEQLVARLRADVARVLWIEPLELPFADTSGIREAWRSAVGNDRYRSLEIDYPRAEDGVHLMPSGYEDWAGKIWRWMSTLVATS